MQPFLRALTDSIAVVFFYCAYSMPWNRNKPGLRSRHQTLPSVFFSFNISFFRSFLLLILPPRDTPETASLFKSAATAFPLTFFLLVERSFQGNRFLLWLGFLSVSHWSAGNREHKDSGAGFKWGWEVVGVVEVGISLAWESLPVSHVPLCRNPKVRA